MIERHIDGLGGQVYYWVNEVESPVALVFCHGLTADHHLFDQQVDYFEDQYKLLVWDWPLHGKSRPYRDFSFNKVSDDLKQILEREGIKKCVMIGQSAGGYIGQSFIKAYPNQVAGFIGIGTTPFGKDYYKQSDLFWLKHVKPIAQLYPFKSYCKACVRSVAITQEARESMQATLEYMGKKDTLAALKAVYDAFLQEENEVDITCPVLLTFGDQDKTGYVKQYNKAWSRKKGYPLVQIDHAAHNANFDNFKTFNQLAIDFVEKQVRPYLINDGYISNI